MYILIVGGGKIGCQLHKTLVDDDHEVLVLEKDPTRCGQITSEWGHIAFRGDGCEAATLEQVGAARADMLIAVTGDDADNLVACQVAKYKFNVSRTISLINDPRHDAFFNKLGIDVTVSALNLILTHIEHELPSHPLVHLLSLKGQGLEIVELKVADESEVSGKNLGEVQLPVGSVVCLVIDKDGNPQIPTADLVLKPDDEVVAVTRPEAEETLRVAFTGAHMESSNG